VSVCIDDNNKWKSGRRAPPPLPHAASPSLQLVAICDLTNELNTPTNAQQRTNK